VHDFGYPLQFMEFVVLRCFCYTLSSQVAWEIFTPLLHRIDEGKLKAVPYEQGGRGPKEADELLNVRAGYVRTDGYIWIPPSLKA
jgi:glucose-6-phosphate 1-dehydrogenase